MRVLEMPLGSAAVDADGDIWVRHPCGKVAIRKGGLAVDDPAVLVAEPLSFPFEVIATNLTAERCEAAVSANREDDRRRARAVVTNATKWCSYSEQARCALGEIELIDGPFGLRAVAR